MFISLLLSTVASCDSSGQFFDLFYRSSRDSFGIAGDSGISVPNFMRL
jgi:hypothetical protein